MLQRIMKTDELTLLVLAAGMGSRYGGLKQLDPMGPGGETLLDYSVHDALAAGFSRVVFVIRRDFEESFRKCVAARYEGRCRVSLVFQELEDLPEGFRVPEGREKPWGTTQAIRAARGAIDGPFLAINADDFYGAEAYRAMAAHLPGCGPTDFAMCGYRLGKTLSTHGSVARGVCRVDDSGHLVRIQEFTKIEKTDSGAADVSGDGAPTRFTGQESVSMNFWGFTPHVFGLIEGVLCEFLRAEGGSLKSESYIPSAVGSMVDAGLCRVKVLETTSEWFGVTYREDKPRVQARLAELTTAGNYPSPLWRT
jgi:hypothetical protein